MKRFATIALATTALFGFTNQGGNLSNEDAKKAAGVITQDQLKEFLTYIASDELQGRDTPSPGLTKAGDYIAAHLKEWGLKPAGDNGTFFQDIKLEKVGYDKSTTKVTVGDATYDYEKDFMVRSGSGKMSGEIVFVALLGENHDYKGKIVLLGKGAQGDYNAIQAARPMAIILDSGTAQANWSAYADGYRQFGGGFRPSQEGTSTAVSQGPAQMASILIHSEGFRAIAKKAGTRAQVNLDAAKEYAMTRNVCATLEGSDPTLSKEYVAFGAHYDHVGMNPNLPGPDKIYNGADDDGSGTVSIMNIAEAFAKSATKPKRSLLFVWHCGEEKGLWGSDYYTKHMTVPKGSIVAQLNIDMIGRSRKSGDTNPRNNSLTGPNAIYVIGTTMMSTRLGEIVHGVNNKYLQIDYDKRYDDPKDPNRFFYRSDHYNYARTGIPICFWFDGEHEDYHQVGDEVSKIDFQKMEKIVRTVFVTGVTVANEPVRPPVDKPLDR